MARYILANRIPFEGVELKAGREVTDDVTAERMRQAGGVLIPLPNPIVEARAKIALKQSAHGRREAEIDIIVAAIAEFMATSVSGVLIISANCLVTDVVNDWVYVTGPAVAGLAQVAKVDVASSAKMPAIGIIISKSVPITCSVMLWGIVVPGLALTPQKVYFLDTTSQITPSVPATRPIFLQSVGQALDDTRFLVKPSITYTKLTP